MTETALVENFFRHEYGWLVASLARRVGGRHIAEIEDAAQTALERALETWPRHGAPDIPSAWLLRVAANSLLDTIRKEERRGRLLSAFADPGQDDGAHAPEARFVREVPDDLLHMLFSCCDPAIPTASQLAFSLKILCGFSVSEIAARLFTTPENVYKRITRARARLAEAPPDFDALSPAVIAARLPAVHHVLYLIFTEGYLSAHPDRAIREELCAEAIRLAGMLAGFAPAQGPDTHALLALMHLHAARLDARRDPLGHLVLLEDQDRGRWDRDQIATGLHWLAKSAAGERFSRYHAEAGIAAEHCLARTFAETRWDRVIACYRLLEDSAPSPLHRLNRALAMAELHGPQAGLEVLAEDAPPTWLEGSYLWAAVRADLHRRNEDQAQAGHHARQALDLAPTAAIRDALSRRLAEVIASQ